MSSDRKIVLKFYRAYYDVMMTLSKKNRLEFIEYVLKVSFFDATLELKPFNNDKLNAAFCIIYGQLLKQQKGYINGRASKKDDLPPPQEEEEEEEQSKEQSKGEEKEYILPTKSKALNSCYSYMDIKNYLEDNAKDLLKDVEFVFEDRLIKVSPSGKLYDVKQVDDLIQIDFGLETRALKYLLNNKGVLK